jgi:hypothetical protein
MDRSARNPVALPGVYSDPRTSPTEQDVYAMGHLFRAIASSEGKNTHNKSPVSEIQMPSLDLGALYQLGYISLRHST